MSLENLDPPVYLFLVYMYIEYAQERVIKGNILLWMKTNLDFNWW